MLTVIIQCHYGHKANVHDMGENYVQDTEPYVPYANIGKEIKEIQEIIGTINPVGDCPKEFLVQRFILSIHI